MRDPLGAMVLEYDSTRRACSAMALSSARRVSGAMAGSCMRAILPVSEDHFAKNRSGAEQQLDALSGRDSHRCTDDPERGDPLIDKLLICDI